jgi:phage terminase large subunit GpA-like protein
LDERFDDHDLTDGLDLGAEDILRAWRRGMRPDADLTVSDWADKHRWLSSHASAEPGRYRTTRTPYLREIMDAPSPGHPAQRVSFMKAALVGATEVGNNWIGFVIHHAPGAMLAVLPARASILADGLTESLRQHGDAPYAWWTGLPSSRSRAS